MTRWTTPRWVAAAGVAALGLAACGATTQGSSGASAAPPTASSTAPSPPSTPSSTAPPSTSPASPTLAPYGGSAVSAPAGFTAYRVPGTTVSLDLPSATRAASGVTLGGAVPASLADLAPVTALYAHSKPDTLRALRLVGEDQTGEALVVEVFQFTVPLHGEATLDASVTSILQGAGATLVDRSVESAKKGTVEALSAVGETRTSYVEAIATTSGSTLLDTLLTGPLGQEAATKVIRLAIQDSLVLR